MNTSEVARIVSVTVVSDYRVKLLFKNGQESTVDLDGYLKGSIFELVRDPEIFRQVRIFGGGLGWPNGADICPDLLYHGGQPSWAHSSGEG